MRRTIISLLFWCLLGMATSQSPTAAASQQELARARPELATVATLRAPSGSVAEKLELSRNTTGSPANERTTASPQGCLCFCRRSQLCEC